MVDLKTDYNVIPICIFLSTLPLGILQQLHARVHSEIADILMPILECVRICV